MLNQMKIVINLLLILLFTSCYNIQPDKNIDINNGVLNIENYDFNKNGKIYLNGLWNFSWKNKKQIDLIKVPSYWNSDKYDNFGYGWYTLVINHNNSTNLGLYLERVHSSYELYVNNNLLMSNGITGNTKEETVPFRKPQLVKLPNESPLIIKWKISNYHHFKGGAYYTPVLGEYNNLEYNFNLSNLIDSIIIGTFLIMFIHYLILFLRKKDEKTHLYFSLLCFFNFLRTLASEHFLHMFFSKCSIFIYELSNKTDYLCVALAAITLLVLIKELLKEIVNLKLNRFLLTIWIIYSVFVFISPMLIYQRIHTVIEILMLITVISILESIIRSIIIGQKKYIFILAGWIVLFFTILNDILIFNNLIISSHLSHIGIFFFILANSIVLSYNFAYAFTKAEYLSKNLEKEVKNTTQIIEDQKNELQEIYNNKTSYFVNISHEIRTPLTLINNYMDKYIDKVGNTQDLSIVKKNIELLIKNITNIFNIQSIELGKVIFNHDQSIEIIQHIYNRMVLFKSLAENKKIKLKLDLPKAKAYTKIDLVAFDNIINNLVENAIKYTNEYGEVLVKVDLIDNIKIKIFNSGEGIDEKNLENIYKMYFQINSKNKVNQGIGLGLSLVKKIVEEVGGSITVWSKKGIGTEFCVEFIKEKNITTVDNNSNNLSLNYYPESLVTIKPNMYLVERHTILLVEDNSELLYFLQSIFYDQFNVFCASNGEDAINQLKYIPQPDIIISDIMMDKIDGLNFYKKIREIDKFKLLPIVYISAKNGEEIKLKCLESGAIDFISKPFNKDELLLKVSSILNLTTKIQSSSISNEQIQKDLEKLYIKYNVSNRQIEMITYLKKGFERKEIAYELGISINTVKTQLKRLFEKCKVNNKTELINIFN